MTKTAATAVLARAIVRAGGDRSTVSATLSEFAYTYPAGSLIAEALAAQPARSRIEHAVAVENNRLHAAAVAQL